MKAYLQHFIKNPLICNVILAGVILSGLFSWRHVGKEEMPEFASNWLRIQLSYPGAAAGDVEHLVTKPIEDQLKGITGIESVNSTSSFGGASLSVIFEPSEDNLPEKIQEVKDAVDRADLPSEVDDPNFRQWKSSEKAIIDVALFHQGKKILKTEDRRLLQSYVLAFKNKIVDLPEISAADANGYLKPEIQIKVDPSKLKYYEITMADIQQAVKRQQVRAPLGFLEDEFESTVTVLSELETPETLRQVVVRSGFNQGQVFLKDLASVQSAFERTDAITKVQGHEAVILNIKKTSHTDILSAQKAVMAFLDRFQSDIANEGIVLMPMDDESYDVRNRLKLIATNGLLGFVLIVIALFIFMDLRAGLWVAMGIPFCLASTLTCAHLLGFTVNNMTLAAIIIVIGIVVDDAIIVAENIDRKLRRGLNPLKAGLEGTSQVFLPILASILTTCAAFVPMYFFKGHFGVFIKYIPTIIILMLGASLYESLTILPSHMTHKSWMTRKLEPRFRKLSDLRSKGLAASEIFYQRVVHFLLKGRLVVVGLAMLLLFGSFKIFTSQMKFVMFPREETSQISVRVKAADDIKRFEMARLIEPIENIFIKDTSGIVEVVRTSIGRSRRGGQVKENEASLRVELLPPGERDIPLKQVLSRWEQEAAQVEGLKEVRFLKSRFGRGSGSPIEIEIQENNDEVRERVVTSLKAQLDQLPYLKNVEVEQPLTKPEFLLEIKQAVLHQLDIDPSRLASTLRSYLEGNILYRITSGDEEVDVRFSVESDNKAKLERVLDLKVGNNQGYLVPISQLVEVKKGEKPANISRISFKRTTSVYADLKEGAKKTPLEIADFLEASVFPKIARTSPSTHFQFRGEIEDSRDSTSDFSSALLMVVLLIYGILVFLYRSLTTPLVIAVIIPFSLIGVVFAFWGHGMNQYGFFAVVGTLGMIGVVVNDAIVMVSRLEEEVSWSGNFLEEIKLVASTRLRAVVLTTITTAVGLMPTAYGIGGYDSMLAEMMLAMAWGLIFATLITLVLLPCIYSFFGQIRFYIRSKMT